MELTDKNLQVRLEIEEVLHAEADLLDDHRYEEWLNLWTDDCRYWIAMTRTVPSDRQEEQYTLMDRGVGWMDNSKRELEMRVKQIKTAVHWAEEPFFRDSHLITNVRVLDSQPSGPGGSLEVRVKCRVLHHRSRFADEDFTIIGKRIDTLRRVDGQWKIARREVYLDQATLLIPNFTNFL